MTVIRLIVDAPAIGELRKMPDELRAALHQFVLRGSVIVVQSMKEAIGERTHSYGRTGNLVGSVRAELSSAGFMVAPTVEYAQFVDQPTRAHDIYPRNARALAFASAGGIISRSRSMGNVRTRFTFGGKTTTVGAVFSKHVRHPGTKGLFFIDATVGMVVDPLVEVLGEEVEAALSHLSVGGSP